MYIAPKSVNLFRSEEKENWFGITNTYTCSSEDTYLDFDISNWWYTWKTIVVYVNNMECGELWSTEVYECANSNDLCNLSTYEYDQYDESNRNQAV